MIISHKHKFIFVHCRKAAGSSIATSLSRFLGDDDLQFSAITDGAKLKIYPPRRITREAIKSMSLKEWMNILTLRRSFWSTVASHVKASYYEKLGASPAHAPAKSVARAFPAEWSRYFKFCVVRNPWDKTLSDYYWRTKRVKTPPTFEQFIESLADQPIDGITPKNHDNWEMYTINDHIEMDYIIRFESLEQDITTALAKTSVEWDNWMPHMKKGSNKPTSSPKRDYRDAYTEHTQSIVAKLYQNEIKTFGYTF